MLFGEVVFLALKANCAHLLSFVVETLLLLIVHQPPAKEKSFLSNIFASRCQCSDEAGFRAFQLSIFIPRASGGLYLASVGDSSVCRADRAQLLQLSHSSLPLLAPGPTHSSIRIRSSICSWASARWVLPACRVGRLFLEGYLILGDQRSASASMDLQAAGSHSDWRVFGPSQPVH